MVRMSARKFGYALVFAAVVVLAGCQAAGLVSQPTAAAKSEAAPPPPEPAPARPADVALFGDHPGGDQADYDGRLLTNMTQHTFSAAGRDFDPDLDAAGEIMVFASTRNTVRPDIFMKHVDGYAITQLTSDPADDIQPRLSPDEQSIVFASNRSGNWDIWLINRDGSELRQLTDTRADEVAPCFSPDGTQVAFTVWGQQSRQWEIWVLSVEQPGVRRFLCYGMFPDWSPDGNRIAFQRARQRGTRWFSVWSIELVGDEARHPTELAYSDSSACIAPRWSPDGKTIVYCSVTPSASASLESGEAVADVWTVDARNGLRFKVTDGAVAAFNPTWSGAGRIFFVSSRAGTENVWSLRTDVGEPALADNRQSAGAGERPAATANEPATAEGK